MTKSVEDYLKTIYKCQQRVAEPIKTNAISDELKLSRASVTEMVQKLSEQGFLTYFPYKGVTLTKKGEQKGKEMLRRHRLIELYLHQQLELPISDVHPEAERLEHAMSNQLVDRIEEKLNFPQFDPHGDPIPQRDGSVPSHKNSFPLSDAHIGIKYKLVRLSNDQKDFLDYCGSIGWGINATIEIQQRYAFDLSLSILIDGSVHHVSCFSAQQCWVIEEEKNEK